MANAIEMAISAAMQGMLPKLMEHIPPELLENIGQIGNTVAGFKAQLDRIENQQRLIISHLKIPMETGIEHG
jgi:hypothetical protein